MSDCLFCRISEGTIPAQLVHSDDRVVAFKDISPKAPTHVLVIPRRHIVSMAALTAEDAELAGHLVLIASRVAREAGLAESGYRTVMNTGMDGGQTVHHLHLHVMGGRPFGWPPG